MGCLCVGQAGLELLTSGDPPASASQNAGITGMSHQYPALLLLTKKEKKLTIKQPQADPSGRIPEEDIVTGAESSPHVTAPEDLSVGQDVEVEDSDIDDPDPVSCFSSSVSKLQSQKRVEDGEGKNKPYASYFLGGMEDADPASHLSLEQGSCLHPVLFNVSLPLNSDHLKDVVQTSANGNIHLFQLTPCQLFVQHLHILKTTIHILESCFVAQDGVQWYSNCSLQPPPLGFK
ncbi:Zinc finger protein 701 [Plecturocebus cupreus]